MGFLDCRYLTDQLWEKMSNYFLKVIWTFNLAACPASQQWVRIPTALHPHPQCYTTYSIFVSLDISVGFFSAFVIICFGMEGFLETTCAICEQESSQIVWLFRLDLFCSEWVPWYFNSYCQNWNALYSLSSWNIIQKLLDISSTCKGQSHFTYKQQSIRKMYSWRNAI